MCFLPFRFSVLILWFSIRPSLHNVFGSKHTTFFVLKTGFRVDIAVEHTQMKKKDSWICVLFITATYWPVLCSVLLICADIILARLSSALEQLFCYAY